MSGAASVKRQRTAGEYLAVIDSLPARTLGDILAEAGQKYPDIAASIVKEYNKLNKLTAADQPTTTSAEQPEATSFEHYSQSAWDILNVKYSRLKCSQQFEKGFYAASQVQNCIKAIRKAIQPHSRYGTKKNALEALLDIGTTICESPGELGKEVKKAFEDPSGFEKTMVQIAKRMTMEERNTLMTRDGFESKLAALECLASGYCLLTDLGNVRSALLEKEKILGAENEEDQEKVEENDDYEDEDFDGDEEEDEDF